MPTQGITYELALRLKNAGFPQTIKKGHKIRKEGDYYAVAYIPSLEELIEACGKDYFMLENGRTGWGGNTKDWKASKTLNELLIVNTGSTPSEAVANLWLSLFEAKG